MNNKKLPIGQVTIEYNEDGTAKSAMFEPTMKLPADLNLLNQLKNVPRSTQEDIKDKASQIFGAWFIHLENVLDEIETADREKFEVKSEIVECEKYSDEHPKKCVISYTFQER